MRSLTAAALLLIGTLNMTTAQAAPEHRTPGVAPCSTGIYAWPIERTTGIERRTQRVDRLLRCFVDLWPVPGGYAYAHYIMDRESGGSPWAYNPSGCSGLFQFARGTWASFIERHPIQRGWYGSDVFSPWANAGAAIRIAHESQGWGPWGG